MYYHFKNVHSSTYTCMCDMVNCNWIKCSYSLNFFESRGLQFAAMGDKFFGCFKNPWNQWKCSSSKYLCYSYSNIYLSQWNFLTLYFEHHTCVINRTLILHGSVHIQYGCIWWYFDILSLLCIRSFSLPCIRHSSMFRRDNK